MHMRTSVYTYDLLLKFDWLVAILYVHNNIMFSDRMGV